MQKLNLSIVTALLLLMSYAHAQTSPQFAFPVDCTLGQDCWVVNYADVDPAEDSVADFRCNAKSYDGHKGTDFAVRSLAEVREGVDVLAAQGGTILRSRDGESDSLKTEEQKQAIIDARRECGNAVLIDHGQSISTIYCHLRNGSITVKNGDKVEAGQVIAQVGQSGMADFPHLHIGVTWEGAIVDPFTGLALEQGCGQFDDNLWRPDIAYSPVSLYDAGFTASAPDFEAIKNGAPSQESFAPSTPAFVFWAAIYGAEEGDQIKLEIRNTAGQLFVERDIVQEKTRARQYYFTGRSLKSRDLPAGEYIGTMTLKRGDDISETITKRVTVAPQ